MEIFKIIGVGLLTCFLAIVVKQVKPEFHLIVLLTGGILIIIMVLKQFTGVIDYFSKIINKTNIDSSLFIIILKVLGVAYLTEFAVGICQDTNNASIGDKIALAGKVIILCLSMPVITNLLNLIIEILP